MARRHLGLRGDGLLTAVERDVRGDIAAGHAEIERRQTQHLVFHADVGDDIVERDIVRAHQFLAREFHVGVERIPFCRIELFHGQGFIPGLHGRLAARLFARIAVGADGGAQVFQAQLLRRHFAAQQGPRLARQVLQCAGQVALAHRALEVLIGPVPAGAVLLAQQSTLGRVVRRFRQQHARQRVQVGHAGAGQAQLQIDAGQRARVRQRAINAGLVLAQHGMRLHGIHGVVVGQ
ncbi:hypothetical protein D3C72_1477810 [compost metagenome]